MVRRIGLGRQVFPRLGGDHPAAERDGIANTLCHERTLCPATPIGGERGSHAEGALPVLHEQGSGCDRGLTREGEVMVPTGLTEEGGDGWRKECREREDLRWELGQ